MAISILETSFQYQGMGIAKQLIPFLWRLALEHHTQHTNEPYPQTHLLVWATNEEVVTSKVLTDAAWIIQQVFVLSDLQWHIYKQLHSQYNDATQIIEHSKAFLKLECKHTVAQRYCLITNLNVIYKPSWWSSLIFRIVFSNGVLCCTLKNYLLSLPNTC